jgi:LPXTG-motif cell wall-anchored protein
VEKFTKTLVAVVAASVLSLAPVAAQAATPGVGDVSNAVRYGNAGPLGTKIDFSNRNAGDPGAGDWDDNSFNTTAAFPLNFFGTKYNRICFSINGGVFPTNDETLDCSEYDLDVAALADSAQAPMVAVLASDTDLSQCDATRGTFDSGANTLTTPSDGWAQPCSVYVGTTTVDGADAVVITWYRVSQYDGLNAPEKFNTYQLLLIKRATGSDANGWDFDFEFNYATLQDDEDGYAVETDGTYDNVNQPECAAYNTLVKTGTYDLCRWGIGVGKYENGVGSVGYEFFEQYRIGQLMDGGDVSMITHSLGSDVLGRYRCSMINGEAQGCDFSAGLAETGADNGQLAILGGLAALSMVAGAAVVARRRKA